MTGELRERIFARDQWTCQRCGSMDHARLSVAHRVKQGKWSEDFLIKYAECNFDLTISRRDATMILDDPENLVTMCRGECNDSANIFYSPMERNRLVDRMMGRYIENSRKI